MDWFLYDNGLRHERVKEDLNKNPQRNNAIIFFDFQNTFTTVLHKHAPIKKKIIRFNNNVFMYKAL